MSKWPKIPASFFQNAGTVLALAISALALFVSVYEANLLKSQQKALVWPYLKVSANYSARGFSLIATNNGTGPALVKSFELQYKGEAMQDYDELLDNIKPDREIGYGRIKMSSFNETVMKSGETRELFNMPWDDETRQMADSMRELGNATRIAGSYNQKILA